MHGMHANWMLTAAGASCHSCASANQHYCHSQRQGRHHSQGHSPLTVVLQWAVRVVAAVQHGVAVELDALARQVLLNARGRKGGCAVVMCSRC